MDWSTVIVAFCSLLGTMAGSYGGMKLMSYRIEQLEKKLSVTINSQNVCRFLKKRWLWQITGSMIWNIRLDEYVTGYGLSGQASTVAGVHCDTDGHGNRFF